jgi:hypothetical protein
MVAGLNGVDGNHSQISDIILVDGWLYAWVSIVYTNGLIDTCVFSNTLVTTSFGLLTRPL